METNSLVHEAGHLLLDGRVTHIASGDGPTETIRLLLADRRRSFDRALAQMGAQVEPLAATAALLVAALGAGRKVLVVGNGGSAAESQHFATELVGRYRRERDAYAVMALTADSALLTAVANDYGYREVFARQVRAFAQPGDLLIAFSTSGESENVLRAAEAARAQGATVVAITADRTSRLERRAEVTIRVPSFDTPIAQELHTIVTHVLCEVVEARLSSPAADVRND